MRTRTVLAAAALLGWAGMATAQETPDALPEGPGQEEVFYTCTACHSTAIIRMQGMSRARWNGIIDEMVRRHGMPEPDDEDRAVMLDYLAEHFPERRTPGFTNPFLNR